MRIYKRKRRSLQQRESIGKLSSVFNFHLTVDALTQLSSDVLSPTTATAEEAKKLIYERNQNEKINPLFETSMFTAGGLGLGILIWLILVLTLCQRQKVSMI